MKDHTNTRPDCIASGELYLPANDLKTEMPFFIKALGFQLDEIFPADDPAVAVLSGHGIRIRLDRNVTSAAARLRLRCTDAKTFASGATTLTSPSGNIIEIVEANPPPVSYTHLRAHETKANLVCRLLLEKKK